MFISRQALLKNHLPPHLLFPHIQTHPSSSTTQILLVPQPRILRALVRGSEARAQAEQDDGLGGRVVVEGIEQDLEVAAEVGFPLLDNVEQAGDAHLLVLQRTAAR